jgi:hypothetical protein
MSGQTVCIGWCRWFVVVNFSLNKTAQQSRAETAYIHSHFGHIGNRLTDRTMHVLEHLSLDKIQALHVPVSAYVK